MDEASCLLNLSVQPDPGLLLQLGLYRCHTIVCCVARSATLPAAQVPSYPPLQKEDNDKVQ